MKRNDKLSRKARYGILAAIVAGAFSIMPAAQALPTGGASDTASITKNGSVMDITSRVASNLLTWQDFSIAKGETVNFAGSNTYLNVVIGNSRSDIFGTINGPQANVWLVNPNGILIGKGAAIDVGSLHLSTADISGSVTNFDAAKIALTSVEVQGDVVNKGTLTAAQDITVDGNNVTFKNVADVTAGTTLTVKAASNEFHVGRNDDSTLSLADGSTAPTYYKLVNTAEELQNIDNDLTNNYMLADDIDLEGVAFRPIGKPANPTTGFSGKFDGIGHVIKNITVNETSNDAGLFAQVNSTGTVENVGLEGGSITGEGVVGGIAGRSKQGTFKNVYNTATVSGTGNSVGGIVGESQGSTIENAYNTGKVSNTGTGQWALTGGIVGGTGWGKATILKNVYNTGDVEGTEWRTGGIVGYLNDGSDKVEYAYNTGAVNNKGGIVGEFARGSVSNAFYTQGSGVGTQKTEADLKQADTFASWAISSDGVDRSAVWRICEGETMPMLTAFMTRKDNVTETYYDGSHDAGYVLSSVASTQTSTQNGTNWVKDVNAVVAKPITVSFADLSKVYDGTTTAAAGAGTLNGVVDKDKESVGVTAEAAYDQKNAGTRTVNYTKVTLTGENSIRNYNLADKATGTGAITAAPLTLTVADVSKQYDGTTDVADGQYAMSGTLYGADSLSGGTYAYADKNVGTGKTVSLTGVTVNDGNEGKNYDLTIVNSTNSIINKKDVTVTFAPASKTYDGTDTAVAAGTLTGVVDADQEAVSVTAKVTYDSKNVGDHAVNYSEVTLTGAAAGNYSITNDVPAGTGTITKAPLTLTVDDYSKEYDGTTSAPGATYSITTGQVFAGDSLSGGTFAFDDIEPGTGNTLTLSGVVVNDGNGGQNYEIPTYVPNTSASITVNTANAKVKLIDDRLADKGSSRSQIEGVTASPDSEPAAVNENSGNGKPQVQGKQTPVHDWDGEKVLTVENEGVNPPASMSAEEVASQEGK